MVHGILEKVISNMKKEPFTLDRNVPLSVLAQLVIERLFMRLRGLAYPNKQGALYVGKNCTIKSKANIRFGSNVCIQRDCFIDALSTESVSFGDNTSIQKKTTIECSGTIKQLGKGLVVGKNVGIGANSYLGCAGGITIGDDTIMGNFVSFHAENHNYQDPGIPIRLQGVNRKGIRVGNNCWIGAKATILDGAFINAGCIVAAGAVVREGVYQENSILAGVPAKVIKSRLEQ
jgi:acetyltransferase-like isoleucine patch superfamily enzyme